MVLNLSTGVYGIRQTTTQIAQKMLPELKTRMYSGNQLKILSSFGFVQTLLASAIIQAWIDIGLITEKLRPLFPHILQPWEYGELGGSEKFK